MEDILKKQVLEDVSQGTKERRRGEKLRKQSEKDFEALTSSIHFLAYPG